MTTAHSTIPTSPIPLFLRQRAGAHSRVDARCQQAVTPVAVCPEPLTTPDAMSASAMISTPHVSRRLRAGARAFLRLQFSQGGGDAQPVAAPIISIAAFWRRESISRPKGGHMATYPLHADRTLDKAESLHAQTLRLATYIRDSLEDDGVIDLAEARTAYEQSIRLADEAQTLVTMAEDTSIREATAIALLRPDDHGQIAEYPRRRAERRGIVVPLFPENPEAA